MFIYVYLPALGFTTLGYKYFYMGGRMLTCILVFYTGPALFLNKLLYFCVCVVQRAVCNSVFSHTGFFPVELHGPAIPKFRINHFSTRSQLLWCCIHVLFIQIKY